MALTIDVVLRHRQGSDDLCCRRHARFRSRDGDDSDGVATATATATAREQWEDGGRAAARRAASRFVLNYQQTVLI